jgi:hypothetical protein
MGRLQQNVYLIQFNSLFIYMLTQQPKGQLQSVHEEKKDKRKRISRPNKYTQINKDKIRAFI